MTTVLRSTSVRDWLDPTRLYNPTMPVSRLQFAWGLLFYPLLVSFALNYGAAVIIASTSGDNHSSVLTAAGSILSIVSILLTAFIILRRLKDLGKSGWYLFALLFPPANLVLLFRLFLVGGSVKHSALTEPAVQPDNKA